MAPDRAVLEGLPRDALEAFEYYRDKIVRWNRRFSISSIEDDQIFDRLIAPSIALGRHYAELAGSSSFRVADFGSGIGIPGIPMAIVDRSSRYCLIESNRRKVALIESVKAELGLARLEIAPIRLAPVGASRANSIGSFNRVTARASIGSIEQIVTLFEGRLEESARFDLFVTTDKFGSAASLKRFIGRSIEIEERRGDFYGVDLAAQNLSILTIAFARI